MKESIGSTASLNIIFAFIAIVFAFLAASLSYYKAFKVNNIITNTIEKYEGYNKLSINEINNKLTSVGYQRFSGDCPNDKSFNGHSFSLVEDNSIEGICVYINDDSNNDFYQYGIITYMTINLPIVNNLLRFPINTTSHEIYRCYGGVCDN